MLRPKTEGKIENLDLQETESFLSDNMISFEKIYQNYCVGIVDVVDSTKIISKLSQEKACIYYGVFLNTIGYIAQSHGAKVVKNIGDGILFYFPKDSPENLKSALECSSKMQEASEMINKIFYKNKMPKIQYRISLDYGPLMIAKYVTSSCKDIFGPTVNLCAKLNHFAAPGGVVIGSDMHQVAKKIKQFRFAQVDNFQSALKHDYPVYSVERV
jgi:class 3 adenylate cyclase